MTKIIHVEKWKDNTLYYNQCFTIKEACVLSLIVPKEVKVNKFMRVVIGQEANNALRAQGLLCSEKQKKCTINYIDIFMFSPTRLRSSFLEKFKVSLTRSI